MGVNIVGVYRRFKAVLTKSIHIENLYPLVCEWTLFPPPFSKVCYHMVFQNVKLTCKDGLLVHTNQRKTAILSTAATTMDFLHFVHDTVIMGLLGGMVFRCLDIHTTTTEKQDNTFPRGRAYKLANQVNINIESIQTLNNNQYIISALLYSAL